MHRHQHPQSGHAPEFRLSLMAFASVRLVAHIWVCWRSIDRPFLVTRAVAVWTMVMHFTQGLYSSVAERQSCKLKVLGSIPSEGCYVNVMAASVRNSSGSPTEGFRSWLLPRMIIDIGWRVTAINCQPCNPSPYSLFALPSCACGWDA